MIHPAHIAPVNEAFTPAPAEIERAQKIVAHFEENPGSGVVNIDGQMIDRPHLRAAEKVLAAARAAGALDGD